MYKLNVIASMIVIASAYGPERAYANFCRLKRFGRSTIAERTQDLFRANRNAETTRQ